MRSMWSIDGQPMSQENKSSNQDNEAVINNIGRNYGLQRMTLELPMLSEQSVDLKEIEFTINDALESAIANEKHPLYFYIGASEEKILVNLWAVNKSTPKSVMQTLLPSHFANQEK